jgi:hypothetical protein
MTRAPLVLSTAAAPPPGGGGGGGGAPPHTACPKTTAKGKATP